MKDIWLSRSPSNKVSKDLQYVIDLPVNDSFALAKWSDWPVFSRFDASDQSKTRQKLKDSWHGHVQLNLSGVIVQTINI